MSHSDELREWAASLPTIQGCPLLEQETQPDYSVSEFKFPKTTGAEICRAYSEGDDDERGVIDMFLDEQREKQYREQNMIFYEMAGIQPLLPL